MSFSKKFLPEIEILAGLYEESESDTKFLDEILGNADVVVGSDEAHSFMSAIVEKVKIEKNLE